MKVNLALRLIIAAAILLTPATPVLALSLLNEWRNNQPKPEQPTIPTIEDDEESASLLAEVIAQSASQEEGLPYEPERYDTYAARLAKTLATLSAVEQQEVVYGK